MAEYTKSALHVGKENGWFLPMTAPRCGIIVSFGGFQGCERAEWEVERFIAHCYADEGLPFVGYNITKAPIGEQGKAAAIPELECCIFVDDRSDILNEIRRTGCRATM